MKLIIKKILVVCCIFGMFISTVYPVVKARYFGYFSNFLVYRYDNQKIGYVQKTVRNGWYVINLGASTRRITVIHQLIDAYGNGKSEWNYTETGTQNNYYTFNCNSGGKYTLQMHLANKNSDNLYDNWSLDYY